MNGPLLLESLSEKTLPQSVDPSLVAYCPSMDLIALGTTDQQVLIYRLNGQRVYGAAQKAGKLRVESIKWKRNGLLLAIAWSDGSVRLIGAESSKIVYQFSTGDDVSGITCVGWGSNLTSKTASSLGSREGVDSWEELLSSDAAISENKVPLDLPQDLSLIDIERSLPKLSVLPAGGSTEEVFSLRSSLDAMFRPFDPKDNNAIDIMIVGTKEGQVHLSIYDSFVVGSFPCPVVNSGDPSRLICHASHEQCSTHSLLIKSPTSDSIFFASMDLRFVSVSNNYLSLLASRSTALQNLLRYLHLVQTSMISEWKSTRELPAKFLRNINETLGEKDDRDIVQALYHSVATGHTFPAVKEWLVDELAERGHKRWEKAVITGLENLRRLVHENMIPALERCSVILSRFYGIAKFQGSNDAIGFSGQQISIIMDTVSCLQLISSRILSQVVDELDLFTGFSSWLRTEIDRLASDSSGSNGDDDIEKEASIDHSKVLQYLQTCMTTSPLEVYFGEAMTEDYQNDWDQFEQALPMFDLLDKQLQKQERGLPYMKALPRVELLCKFLTRQAKTIFSRIAEAEKRNVLFGTPQEVGIAASQGPRDMRMSKVANSTCRTHIAFVPKDQANSIHISRVVLAIESGISTVRETSTSALSLGDGRIRDVKFFDNNILLVLWEWDGKSNLLSIPYEPRQNLDATQPEVESYHMEYFAQTRSAHKPAAFGNSEVLGLFSKIKIPDEGSFVPAKLEIKGQTSTKESDTRRIIVLAKDRLHYKILKLPRTDPSRGEEGAAMDEDVSMS